MSETFGLTIGKINYLLILLGTTIATTISMMASINNMEQITPNFLALLLIVCRIFEVAGISFFVLSVAPLCFLMFSDFFIFSLDFISSEHLPIILIMVGSKIYGAIDQKFKTTILNKHVTLTCHISIYLGNDESAHPV